MLVLTAGKEDFDRKVLWEMSVLLAVLDRFVEILLGEEQASVIDELCVEPKCKYLPLRWIGNEDRFRRCLVQDNFQSGSLTSLFL